MKNILFILSIVLLGTFSSCQKDDENNTLNSDLIGKWAETPSTEQLTYVFTSNGEGSYQIKNCDSNELIDADSFTFTFNSETNKITFKWGGDTSIGYIKFINETTIRLYNDASFTDSWSSEMYKQ